jgi:hypothetical protein
LSDNNWIAGDGKQYSYDMRKSISKDDEIIIVVENTDSNYNYTADIEVSIDYEVTLLNKFINSIKGMI